ANSLAFVLPKMFAPARRRRATAGASANGVYSANNLVPPVVRKPRVAIASLIVSGRPQSGGTSPPRMSRRSASRAASNASGANVTMAFRRGFNSSARRKYAAHTSTGATPRPRGCAERAVAAIDETDRARPFGFGERDDGELAASLFINHARTRHNRHAEADFDRALDRLNVVELGHLMNIDAVRAQDAVSRLARRDVTLEQDEVH